MKRSATILILFLVSVLISIPSMAQPPATLWQQVLPGHTGYGVKPASDGGYIVAGDYNQANDTDMQVVKADSAGQVQWSYHFGSFDWFEEGRDVQQTADGGYIVVGQTGTWDAGNQLWLVNRDADGNAIWSHTYGGSGSERGYRVEQTADGSFMAFGNTSTGIDDIDGYILKVDALGNELWSGNYGGPNHDRCRCGQMTADGGYILAGDQLDSDYISTDFWLTKVDANGNQEWSRTYGGTEGEWCYDCIQTSDGGYILTGYSQSYGIGYFGDAVLLKTDANGDLMWARNYGESGADRGQSVIELPDGGFLMAGASEPAGGNSQHAWLVRTDSDGNLLWDEYYAEDGFSFAYDIEATPNGGFVLTGRCQEPDYGIMLLRLGADGVSHLTLTLLPINPPVIIPAEGGSFHFTATVANSLDERVHFDAWTELVLPGGNTYGPVMLWRDLRLGPGQTVVRELEQPVPAGLAAGTYDYRGVVGSNPNSVYSSDEFEIEKLEP